MAKPQMSLAAGAFATAQTFRDLRATIRYALRARVVFAWYDDSGQRHESQGLTRDLGHKGTYIVARERPPAGSAVELRIFLPLKADQTRALQIEAESYVVRVEPALGASDSAGFAVAHHRLNLFANESN
jgi:hypothetical protein